MPLQCLRGRQSFLSLWCCACHIPTPTAATWKTSSPSTIAASLLERQWYTPLQIFSEDKQHMSGKMYIAEATIRFVHIAASQVALNCCVGVLCLQWYVHSIALSDWQSILISVDLLMHIHADLRSLCIASLIA